MPTINIKIQKEVLILDEFPLKFDMYSFRVYKLALAEALQSQTCKLLQQRPVVKTKVTEDHYLVSIKTCCNAFNDEINDFLIDHNLK
jgi:hypothetical protein